MALQSMSKFPHLRLRQSLMGYTLRFKNYAFLLFQRETFVKGAFVIVYHKIFWNKLHFIILVENILVLGAL